MDLLVSYSWHRFNRAKHEVIRLLRQFGDDHPEVEKTSVWGIAIAHTTLDNRQVIRLCWQRLQDDPGDFEWSVKWLPVDYWCVTDLDSIKKVIDEQIKPNLPVNESWAMKVKKRRWQKYHTIDIVLFLTEGLTGKVNLDDPDNIIWVDVLGRETAISLLNPEDIFSLNLPHL
jgi:tRNA(Ser,Leu) C12 N-acetylase TAN1